jgi:multiple sugar transport system ATP-binding protein
MRTEIKLMHQRLKTTTVYVTHDQIEAMTLGDKVAVMKDGIIQQFGTPQDIYNNPANLFVASFIGSPPMNFIPARLTRQDGRVLALLDSGQARCELPLGVEADGWTGARSSWHARSRSRWARARQRPAGYPRRRCR